MCTFYPSCLGLEENELRVEPRSYLVGTNPSEHGEVASSPSAWNIFIPKRFQVPATLELITVTTQLEAQMALHLGRSNVFISVMLPNA
jgi:hypothetical protein